MLPTIRAFMAAHQLTNVTIVADAGMVSDGNRRAMEAAGLSFILGARIPDIPYAGTEGHRQHPDQEPPDGLVLTQPRPAGPRDRRRDEVVYYQYRADRARRTLRGIDEQVTKAERAVAGKVAVKRNRFITLTGADKSVNRTLEAKARALAGWKGYITNVPNAGAEFVIGAYHRLFEIERSFRMSKHDLAARPIYHHKRAWIEAHLTIVRRTRRLSVRRGTHRLVDPQVRAHRPPLPHRHHPRRPATPHRRRPTPRRPTRGARPHPMTGGGANLGRVGTNDAAGLPAC